ncbi:MAG: cell division protein ZipA [Gammaproteobacteria bacterium]
MDNLRILLMILGIFIIAGIYLWGIGFDHRKATRNLKKRRKDLEEPILETPVIKPREEEMDFTDVFRRQGGLFRDEDVDLPHEAAGSNSRSKPGVIVFYVTSPSGFSFNGVAVRDALYSAGLSYGDMQIFHHHGVGQSVTKENIFSVANIHEPGTFDLKNMEELQTEGLVIFMELPAPIDAAVGFEHMLSTAQRLADILKGHVRDEKREHLTPEAIESIRSYVAGINV